MKVLGITGGVGSGKSTILHYLEERYHAVLLVCDEIAAMLQKPGGSCYEPMKELFQEYMDGQVPDPLGENVSIDTDFIQADGNFNRKRIAEIVFSDPEMLRKLNGIVHPAVKAYVRERIALEREMGDVPLVVVEAALLLEDHYGEICDEIWFIYANEKVRRERLKTNRGYSDEKITKMMNAQRPEAFFRKNCQFTVDNSMDNVENTYGQIDEGLKKHGLL